MAVRKIGVAAIGVFGSEMETMQVHLTLLLVAINLVLTLHTQPYGNAKPGLQLLDQSLMLCLLLTLWAGNVFNSHPRCEVANGEEGETLGWCDFLSVVIGLVNLMAGVIAVLYFMHLKGICTCFGKTLSDVLDCARRRATARRQAAIRMRTTDAPDTTTVRNPAAGNVEIAVELSGMNSNPMQNHTDPGCGNKNTAL